MAEITLSGTMATQRPARTFFVLVTVVTVSLDQSARLMIAGQKIAILLPKLTWPSFKSVPSFPFLDPLREGRIGWLTPVPGHLTNRQGCLKAGVGGLFPSHSPPSEEHSVADRDPNLIISSLSREVSRDGVTVKVEIYRLEDRPGWALEIVNDKGTSIAWDELFDTDDAADAAFRETVEVEGMATFLDGATVIPFRQ